MRATALCRTARYTTSGAMAYSSPDTGVDDAAAFSTPRLLAGWTTSSLGTRSVAMVPPLLKPLRRCQQTGVTMSAPSAPPPPPLTPCPHLEKQWPHTVGLCGPPRWRYPRLQPQHRCGARSSRTCPNVLAYVCRCVQAYVAVWWSPSAGERAKRSRRSLASSQEPQRVHRMSSAATPANWRRKLLSTTPLTPERMRMRPESMPRNRA